MIQHTTHEGLTSLIIPSPPTQIIPERNAREVV